MAKPRLKRYQSGGKVKHYVTGGEVVPDPPDDFKPQNTPDAVEASSAPVSSTPPRTTPVVSGTRAAPMSGAQVAAARNVRAARTLPATNPATALKTPSPPFGNTAAPTASVGGNQAVINTPYGPAKQPAIDPMANARALDAGARQTETGVGSGAGTAANTRDFLNKAPIGPTGTRDAYLPSGGFASVGPAKTPVTPTQVPGQTALAGPNIRRPGFVYGGRVADNTIPKKVGMQKPMPFMHGGKVKMWSGGRVRKMQDGGRADLLADADNSFYGGGNAPKPTPTATPKPGFLNKVKGVAKAIADRTGFQDGGMVRVDEAARDTQSSFAIPPRHQFKSGGKLPPDNVPAMLGKGEVVLNKNQQKKVVVKPNWQNGLNPKEKSAMSEMNLPRMRKQHAMTGKSVPRIFGGK